MKQSLLFIFISLTVLSSRLVSQTHCDGTRYIEPVFENIDSTIAIQFGENVTAAGNDKALFMDIYYPEAEFFFRRPLVVLAHGGSFVSGNRKHLRLFCIELAERGFVAATIDYRLYDAFNQPIDSIAVYDVGIKATSDMKASVRWFKENASLSNDFGIDTNNIIIGGVSAGAITALQFAYLDSNDYVSGSTIDSVIQANGGIRGNSSANYAHSDNVKGVLNFSGALKDGHWIDPGENTVFSVHDEFDDVVPYGQDVSTELGTPVEVSGSAEVHRQAKLDGIRSQLITIKGSEEHVSYFLNGQNTADYKLVMDSTAIFLEYTVCDRVQKAGHPVDKELVRLFPNPSSSRIHIRSGQKIKEVSLISMEGKLMKRTSDLDDVSTIDVSDLPAGIYQSLIRFNDHTTVEKRISIN
ncbi:MAG: T9SS type A sorting domain-containing protein [Salibacteraceae bacterium]